MTRRWQDPRFVNRLKRITKRIDMASSTDAGPGRRADQIRLLARKLEENTLLNTVRSRDRCRQLALDILELLDEEDEEHLATPQFGDPDHAGAFDRLHEAIRTCSEAREQAELTRLFSASDRVHRQTDENGSSGTPDGRLVVDPDISTKSA
jgi:hypothetical protein